MVLDAAHRAFSGHWMAQDGIMIKGVTALGDSDTLVGRVAWKLEGHRALEGRVRANLARRVALGALGRSLLRTECLGSGF